MRSKGILLTALLLGAAAIAPAQKSKSMRAARYPDPVHDPLVIGLKNFGAKVGGWGDANKHPRQMADVNGDGRADIVGFGGAAVWVSLSLGPGTHGASTTETLPGNIKVTTERRFQESVNWMDAFHTNAGGWVSFDNFPRLMGDVNGDGKADIVSFAAQGVFVSTSTGSRFDHPLKWADGYNADAGWSSFDAYPRALGDVNGDGKADLVGFAEAGVSVSLSTGSSFAPGVQWIKNFTRGAGGWVSFNRLPRHLADVNGDGRADIVGFGDAAVWVSLSQGSAFEAPKAWVAGFVESVGGWSTQSQYPRYVIDVNKDRKADIVGFGEEEVVVSLSTGAAFGQAEIWTRRMTNVEGWTDNQNMPRLLGDYLGDGLPGLVGFSPEGVRPVRNIEGVSFDQLEPDQPWPAAETFCWKDTYVRGVGKVAASCASGQEDSNGICYPVCPAGMKGDGPLCWQTCPQGFGDIGVSCAKPKATSSGGFGWQFGDKAFDYDTGPRARCEAENGAGNCYRNGLIWYPKCKPGFHKVGDLVCSPDCPATMRDDGAYCAKTTSPRGAGSGITYCDPSMVADAGLCYPPCTPAYDGVAHLCWGKCTGQLPFSCGGGCATNQAACAAAVTNITTQTIGAAINVLGMVAGGPGIGAAARAGAKAGKTAAGKFVFKPSLADITGGLGAKAWDFSKDFVQTFGKTFVKDQFDSRNMFFTIVGQVKGANVRQINQLATENAQLAASGGLDLTALTVLDPTGISSAVLSFTKYSSCGTEPITLMANTVDLGTAPEKAQTVTIKVNKPTTFLHIGTPAYSNCSIVPTTTCQGKKFEPGQECTVSVSAATGGQKLLGELRIYTSEAEVFPYPIQVTANAGGASECQVVNDPEEAANLTTVSGVWAWNGDIAKKFVVMSNGSIVPVGNWTTPGKVTVLNSNQRSLQFAFGAATPSTGEVLTVSRHNDQLMSGATVKAVRRPWNPRCQPGMQLVNGFCYDIPVGLELYERRGGAPVYSQACPAGYEDLDGNTCVPIWTGKYVWGTPRTPSIVTDCSMRVCPAGFTKVACSCQANAIQKQTVPATRYPTL